jgi:O-antigen ligase
MAAAVIAVAQASGITQGFGRWQRISEQLPADIRWQAYKAAVTALPDAGWTGFGPGTFSAIFSRYAWTLGLQSAGRWEFLHEDYLQTLLEWGVFGALAWAALLFGGMAGGVIGWRRMKAAQPKHRMARLLPLLLLALGATAGHALIDFPLQVSSLQLYVATYLGICWASTRQVAKIDNSARR